MKLVLMVNIPKAISLPADATDKERKLVQRIAKVKGEDRGTLRTQIAEFSSSTSQHFAVGQLSYIITVGNIIPPNQKMKFTDLRSMLHANIYQLLLAFLRTNLVDDNIVDDLTVEQGTTVFAASHSTQVLSHLIKDGIRFGCSTEIRKQANQYASVNFQGYRAPCRILYHFAIHLGQRPPIYCCAIQRALSDDTIPLMPWTL